MSIYEGNIMEVQPDFRDLFALFNEHDVEYVIVGAYALAFHGAPRYIGDMKTFVKPDAGNAGRILDDSPNQALQRTAERRR